MLNADETTGLSDAAITALADFFLDFSAKVDAGEIELPDDPCPRLRVRSADQDSTENH